MTESTGGKILRGIFTSLEIAGLGVLGYFGLQHLIKSNADVQLELAKQIAALNDPNAITLTLPPTEPPVESDFGGNPGGSETIMLANEPWPMEARDFLAAIQVPEDQVAAELKADPYYRPLQEGMITKEYDADGHWTGGWQILLERDAGNGDRFPFVVIRNSGTTMQYGYMHDADLRVRAGFTAEEVAILGIGANHIGAGVPVTGNAPVAVEGMTFYPPVNDIDGSHNTHTLLSLGTNMQTMDQRLARFTHSSTKDSKSRALVSTIDSIFGPEDDIFANLRTSPGVTFILDPAKTVNNSFGAFQLGGSLPNRIRSFTDLPKNAQAFQRNPRKGIRRS